MSLSKSKEGQNEATFASSASHQTPDQHSVTTNHPKVEDKTNTDAPAFSLPYVLVHTALGAHKCKCHDCDPDFHKEVQKRAYEFAKQQYA